MPSIQLFHNKTCMNADSDTYLKSTWLKSRVDILATFPDAETGRVV